jgi:hypothetical protein
MRYFNSPVLRGRNTSLVFFLVIGSFTHAQTPTHQSVVHNLVGSLQSEVNGIAADGSGNMIITGWRTDSLDFGGTPHPQGAGAIFLAKFDAQGNELWSKVSGSADQQGNHKGMSVAVDAAGNVYNSGWVFAPEQATFDGTTLPQGTYGYVAKYTAGGALTWVKDFPGGVNAIAVDHDGIPYINLGDGTIERLDPATGNSTASGTGGGDLQNVVYHNIVVDANNNVFAQWGNKITKYDNDLNVLWSTALVKSFGCESFRISVDATGDVWATFYAIFGTVTLGGTDYTNLPNGYIYRLSGSTGEVLNCTSPGAYKIKKVIAGEAGALYALGDFAFNTPYVVKYDASLTGLWSAATFKAADMLELGPECFMLGGSHDETITLDGTTYERPNNSGQINAMAAYLCSGDVGMEEEGAAWLELAAYPNPASSTFTISGTEARGDITVLNTEGRIVLRERSLKGRTELNVQMLPTGMYTVRDQHGRSVRAVVQH